MLMYGTFIERPLTQPQRRCMQIWLIMVNGRPILWNCRLPASEAVYVIWCKLKFSKEATTKESCNGIDFIYVEQCKWRYWSVAAPLHTARCCIPQSFALPQLQLLSSAALVPKSTSGVKAPVSLGTRIEPHNLVHYLWLEPAIQGREAKSYR